MIVFQTRDLLILISNDLLFNEHTHLMCNKAFRVFGLIRHNCSEFKNPNCFKILYYTLVRSILKYGFFFLNLYQNGSTNKIDRV